MSIHLPSCRMRPCAPILAIALALAVPRVALADTRDPAAAEALFGKARERIAAKDYAAACPMLAESQRLDPAAGTLLNLADCEEQLGDLARAWAHWREAIDQLPAKDDALPVAKRRLEALEARVPRLTVQLAGGAPAGTRVMRDGVEVAAAALGVAMVVNPGVHVVVVTAPGRAERRETVTLREGEQRPVPLMVGPEVPTAPPPVVVPPPVPEWKWSRHKASILTGSTAVVLAGAGLGVALKILPDHAAFTEKCSTQRCTPADGATLRAEVIATNVLFAAAAAAAVTSVVLFFTVERKGRPATASLVPMGAGAGVIVRY